MTANFPPDAAPIILEAFITGSRRSARIRLALDTGAAGTLIRRSLLVGLGYDLSASTRRWHLRAATGGAVAPGIDVRQLLVLGSLRSDFPVAAHDLPPVLPYDGLLGLDFFRGLILRLDFVRGRVSLYPRRWWQFWR